MIGETTNHSSLIYAATLISDYRILHRLLDRGSLCPVWTREIPPWLKMRSTVAEVARTQYTALINLFRFFKNVG